MCNLNIQRNERNVKPPLENKNKIPPHCPQDSNLNSKPQGKLRKSKEFRILLTVGLTSHN
jgi:hypothetical protein